LIAKRIAAILAVWMACGLALASAGARTNHGTWTVESVLARLDEASKIFRSLSADVERTKVTVVVNDQSTETGTIVVRGDKMLLDMKAPDKRTILRAGDMVYVYTPGLNRVEEYNLGKNRTLADQYLQLGFGMSGNELRKSYLVTVVGETTVGDKKTVEVELTPKSEQVRQQFSKIEIWFDEANWLPAQQRFDETGSGDYVVIHYTNVALNPAVSDSQFKPRWPKGTERVKPQQLNGSM
jgi:outer membrane lipoprotein-sorting protein